MSILPKCAVVLLSVFLTSLASAQMTFTTIDVPGAGFTGLLGINTMGDTVGYYGESGDGPYHGFLLQDGEFTFFDFPGANSNRVSGINDSGLIVGNTVGVKEQGFLYDGTAFTSIRLGQMSATVCWGINNAGVVVGGAGSIYTTRAFELRDGHFKILNVPGDSVYVYATGINNLEEVVGWTDSDGFLYRRGKFKTIHFPGSTTTEAWSINDSGAIVGWYVKGSSVSGFALRNGRYTSFGYPGALYTLAFGINAAGQIVGAYTFDNVTYHGFVTGSFVGEM